MILKNLKKCLAVTVAAGLVFGTVSSSVVSAGGGKNSSDSEYSSGKEENNLSEEVLKYLLEKEIEIKDYTEFIKKSGLSFERMKKILDDGRSIDFYYLQVLSQFMHSEWVNSKYKNTANSVIFEEFLEILQMFNIDHSNIETVCNMLSQFKVYFYDLYNTVKIEFLSSKRYNLSIKDLESYFRKLAGLSENFNDDNAEDKETKQSICTHIMKKANLKLNYILAYLKDEESGEEELEDEKIENLDYESLVGLKYIVDFSDKCHLKVKSVIETFKNSQISFVEAKSVCDKICGEFRVGFKDFVETLSKFNECSSDDFIYVAKNFKKYKKSDKKQNSTKNLYLVEFEKYIAYQEEDQKEMEYQKNKDVEDKKTKYSKKDKEEPKCKGKQKNKKKRQK